MINETATRSNDIMKTCVVTGANSGIGKAVAGRLTEKGYKVYCIGGPGGFEDNEAGENVVRLSLDFRKESDIKKVAEAVKEDSLDLLVNAAGAAFYGVAESIRPCDIAAMADVNVKAPLVITSMLMPKIRKAKGAVINVSSVTAETYANPHGAAYGATKAALTSFGRSLFEEVRKHGVRVINVHPDLTDTNLYRNADFTVTGEPDSTLFAEDVAGQIEFVLGAREGSCVTDITVRPQKNRIVKKG